MYVCEPSATDTTVFDQLPTPDAVVVPREVGPSKISTVAPASAEPESVNEPVLLCVPSTGASIVGAAGAVVSIVHVRLAGVGSTLPAASVALTRKLCGPSERPEYVNGDEQPENAAPSRLQAKLEPLSLEVNVKVALVTFVGFAGADPILVSGALVSIVHVYEAGVGSVFPAGSVARTWKVCVPSVNPL